MRLIGIVLMTAFLPACVTVGSITLSQVPAQSQRKAKIEAEEHGIVVLGIPFGTDYVEKSAKGLQEKCVGKRVEGVLAKHEVVNYILFDIRRSKLSGYCV